MCYEFTSSVLVYSLYAVVVVSGGQLQNTPREVITNRNEILPPPYPPTDGIYTAAVWTRPEDVPQTFVVGTESRTVGPLPNRTQYINGRLEEGTEYGVFYYIQLQSDVAVSLTITVILTKCIDAVIYRDNQVHCWLLMITSEELQQWSLQMMVLMVGP